MKIMTTRGRLAAALTVAPLLTTVLAAPASAALSQCPSGYFCVWARTGFSGDIQKFSATNSYRTITVDATESYYNHRSKRTWLHASPTGDGQHVCIDPGDSSSNTSGWQDSAKAVYLATVASC